MDSLQPASGPSLLASPLRTEVCSEKGTSDVEVAGVGAGQWLGSGTTECVLIGYEVLEWQWLLWLSVCSSVQWGPSQSPPVVRVERMG